MERCDCGQRKSPAAKMCLKCKLKKVRGPQREEKLMMARDLLLDGGSWREAAKIVGVSVQRIKQLSKLWVGFSEMLGYQISPRYGGAVRPGHHDHASARIYTQLFWKKSRYL